MSWADREPDEPLEDWMLRLQISHAAAESRPVTSAIVPAPGVAFVTGTLAGWVTFRHSLPDPMSVPGSPS